MGVQVPLGNNGRGVSLPPCYTCTSHQVAVLMTGCNPETWASGEKQKCLRPQTGKYELPTAFWRGRMLEMHYV